jgi:hypothetical protein
MTHSFIKPGLPLRVALAAGCTTMGTGFGSTASGTRQCQLPKGNTIDATFPKARG